MLYPASITFDFYVQADTVEQAQKVLQYAVDNNDLSIEVDEIEYPEINLDSIEVSSHSVIENDSTQLSTKTKKDSYSLIMGTFFFRDDNNIEIDELTFYHSNVGMDFVNAVDNNINSFENCKNALATDYFAYPNNRPFGYRLITRSKKVFDKLQTMNKFKDYVLLIDVNDDEEDIKEKLNNF